MTLFFEIHPNIHDRTRFLFEWEGPVLPSKGDILELDSILNDDNTPGYIKNKRYKVLNKSWYRYESGVFPTIHLVEL